MIEANSQNRKLPTWAQRASMAFVYTGLAGYVGFHVAHHGLPTKLVAEPCVAPGSKVSITAEPDAFSPDPVELHRCDSVTIVNNSGKYIQPALGPHDKHIIYPTFKVRPLKNGHNMNFIAGVPGTFELHDHLEDKLEVEVTITP